MDYGFHFLLTITHLQVIVINIAFVVSKIWKVHRGKAFLPFTLFDRSRGASGKLVFPRRTYVVFEPSRGALPCVLRSPPSINTLSFSWCPSQYLQTPCTYSQSRTFTRKHFFGESTGTIEHPPKGQFIFSQRHHLPFIMIKTQPNERGTMNLEVEHHGPNHHGIELAA
jgi:hypothetical protein